MRIMAVAYSPDHTRKAVRASSCPHPAWIRGEKPLMLSRARQNTYILQGIGSSAYKVVGRDGGNQHCLRG